MEGRTRRAGERAAGALLAALLASGALQAQEVYDASPAAKAALEQLRTDDLAQQKARWGAFAELAGKSYLVQDLGSYEVMWRELEWIVPGAVMRFGNGMCRSGECHHADYTAQYNAEEKRVDFYYGNDRKLAGQVRPDGVLAIRYGFISFENVGIAGGAYKTDSYALEPTTQARLLALSKGKAGNRQVAAPEAAAARAPAAEAPPTPAVQDALAATGLPLAELRSRFGGLLDLLDRRFMDGDGQDVSWFAFEWLETGVSIRMWVVGCGNFGCGEPYQVHLRPSGTHGVLEYYDTYERSTRYLFVEPDGALRLQSTRNGLVLGRWRATAGGNLGMYGRSYRAVDAETLARATQGRSRVVALAADTPRPAKAAPQPAPVKNAAPAPAPAPAAPAVAAAPPRGTGDASAAGDLRSQLASMQAQMAELARKIEEQEKAAVPATSAAPAGRPTPAAAVARPAPAGAAPAGKPVGAAARCGVTEGLYAAAGDGYQIHVRFEGDALVVKETNRTSPYAHLGQCRFGFTAPSGTVFRLMATQRGLIAYREGRDPESTGTLLTLRRPAVAPSKLTSACKAQEVVPHNPGALNPNAVEKLYGIRQIPDESARLAGTYRAAERDGHPQTELRGDGTGRFEVYGAPAAEHVYGIRQWWVQSNCDGTPIAENHARGSRYLLVFELDRPYQGESWLRHDLIILKSENRMLHLDRVKPK